MWIELDCSEVNILILYTHLNGKERERIWDRENGKDGRSDDSPRPYWNVNSFGTDIYIQKPYFLQDFISLDCIALKEVQHIIYQMILLENIKKKEISV